MRKALLAKEDAWLAILEYRNTPSQSDRSPVQRLFGRGTRTRTLTHESYLSGTEAPVGKRRDVEKIKKAYNQRAKDLKQLAVGDTVRVQPQE